MRPRIRFHPPDVPMPPGVQWTLRRAFGPVGAAVTDTDEPKDRLNAAIRLGLVPRISARQSSETLSAELGAEVAQDLGSANARANGKRSCHRERSARDLNRSASRTAPHRLT